MNKNTEAYLTGMVAECRENAKDVNNILTTADLPVWAHNHYYGIDGSGIATLIAEILTDSQATFPATVGETALRPVAIAASLFASDIISQVQARFAAGSKRYPAKTVNQYLSVFLFRSGKVGKIRLTNEEDSDRECCKPRCKWFLIQ